MFRGDISNFSPADLLVFLAHLNKEGVLTVRRADESLCFSFRQGQLIDAHAEAVDRKVLDMIGRSDRVDSQTLGRVAQAQRETGLSLRQIIENMESIPARDVAEPLAAGVRETVFQLFLWESGEFQFAELTVDTNQDFAALDCQAVTMDVSREVDEYREAMRYLGAEDQKLVLTPAGREAEPAEGAECYVLEQARGDRALGDLLACGPFRTCDLVSAVVAVRARGWIELARENVVAAVTEAGDGGFQAFRRALRGLLTADHLEVRIRELAAYCRDHCDCTLLLAARQGELVRCRSYQRDEEGKTVLADRDESGLRLDADPVFERVTATGLPFYGRVFASDLLQKLGVEPPDGDCAVIPLTRSDSQQLVLFAAVAGSPGLPGPLNYLELLGWHIQPPVAPSAPAATPAQAATADQADEQPVSAAEGEGGAVADEAAMRRMVTSIKELPAMPDVVSAVIKQLSDPDCPMSRLAEILSRDPALVARLIKVSNSALYGASQEISSLNQALVRLGIRTIRNLVIAASSRSLFPMNNTQIGLWGRSLWDHSVECGVASKWVAAAVGYPDPDEAFAAGVLHDIGKVIILLNLPDEFRAILKAMEAEGLDSRTAEVRVLGFDHARVGAWLLERWDMPAELSTGIVHHHDPAAAGEYERLARIVACGDTLSHRFGSGTAWGAAATPELLAVQMAEVGLAVERAEELREMLQAETQEDSLVV